MDNGLALLMQLFCEFHNQNRVLTDQADGRQQTDLEVHVVVHAESTRHTERTDYAQRHNQDDGDRNRPAFIKSGQTQEHDQNRQRVKCAGLRSGLLFLEGNTVPGDTESVRQSLGDFFHRKHRLTGRKACCRRSLNIHSAQAVETLQTRGTELPLSRAESGERNHFAFIVAHVPAVQVFRTLTELLIALNINLLNTAAVVEVIDVGGTPSSRQRIVNGCHADA